MLMHYHHYFKLLNRYHHYSTGDRYERACSRFTRQNCKHNSINYVKFKTTFGKYVKMIKQLRALKTNNASIAVNFEAKKIQIISILHVRMHVVQKFDYFSVACGIYNVKAM